MKLKLQNLWKRIPFETKFGWVIFVISLLFVSWVSEEPIEKIQIFTHFIFCSVIFLLKVPE